MSLAEVHADLKDTLHWALGRLRLIEANLNLNGSRYMDEANAREIGQVIERLERKLS